jgi:hypothetical protein
MQFSVLTAGRRVVALVLLAWMAASLSSPAARAQSDLADPASAAADTGQTVGSAAPAALGAQANAAPLGYHFNMGNAFKNVSRFTVPDAHLATIVGPQTAIILGMDYDGQSIWGLNGSTKQVGIISQQTAVFSAVAPLSGIPSPETLNGLTIAADGTFYVSTATYPSTSTIFTLNPQTGALSPLGKIVGSYVVALAINCAGELYGHDITGNRILRIPVNDPAGATVVGPTGQDTNFSQGMDFDDTTNTLYAWLYRGSGAGDFAAINTSTGAATAVTPLTGEFEGLIMTTCATTITSPAPPAGAYGQPYAHTFTATGAQTITMSLSGALPPGLGWSANTATISGTPTLAGSFPNLLLTASGATGNTATQPFTLTISPASQPPLYLPRIQRP